MASFQRRGDYQWEAKIRVAFPDLFVARLTDSKVKSGLAKLIEPIHKNLSAVYFDLDNGIALDRSDGSAYALKIVLVYPPGDDPEETAEEIDQLAERIEDLFARRFYDKAADQWNGVHLTSSTRSRPCSAALRPPGAPLTAWACPNRPALRRRDGNSRQVTHT